MDPKKVKAYEVFPNADISYRSGNLKSKNNEGQVGKHGHDKKLTLEEVMEIAYKTVQDPKSENPNVIVKSGKNAKWYFKNCPDRDMLVSKIKRWRRSTIGQAFLKRKYPPGLIYVHWRNCSTKTTTAICDGDQGDGFLVAVAKEEEVYIKKNTRKKNVIVDSDTETDTDSDTESDELLFPKSRGKLEKKK